MICYLSKNYRRMDGAGDKAKTDIESIMALRGFRNLGLSQKRVKNSLWAFFITLISVLKGVCCLRKGDVLILQYPLKKYYTFVCRMARRRGARVITLIHDLGSFRSKRLTVEQEVARLNLSHVLIVHSESMKEWLSQHGVTSDMVVLNVFDFLSELKNEVVWDQRVSGRPWQMVFIGELSPVHNGFIYKMAAGAKFYNLQLYGKSFEHCGNDKNIDYRGFVTSDDLIRTTRGDFGIVWYGSSLDEGEGPLGEYLRYNAPHKLSLYLRCGLPIIIWDKAGLASFVQMNGLGICLSSLRDLDEVLANMTTDRYLEMRNRVLEVSDRLSEGYYVSRAIGEACERLNVQR